MDVVKEMDKESESLEELGYCLTLLDDGRSGKNRKEVESAPHPTMLAEGTSCIVQYICLRGREAVTRRSSGGMVWENRLVDDVGYFQMELVEKAARNGHGSSKAGIAVFEIENVVVWHDED